MKFSDLIDSRFASTRPGPDTKVWKNFLSAACQLRDTVASFVLPPNVAPIESQLLSILDALAGRYSVQAYTLQSATSDIDSLRAAIYAAAPADNRGEFSPQLYGASARGFLDDRWLVATDCREGTYEKFCSAARKLFSFADGGNRESEPQIPLIEQLR